MKIQSQEILELIAKFDNKLINENELSNWASNLLEKGIDTEALILLAGLTPSEYGEAYTLLNKAVSELGYSWPSERLINLTYAKYIASQILTGKIQPNEGCAQIGEINQNLNWPDELSYFGMLSHEQTGHENIGITSESIVPEIMTAAKELMELEITF